MSKAQTYIAADGIEYVAGRKVKPGEQIHLTKQEALYEEGLGRIKPYTKSKPSGSNVGGTVESDKAGKGTD